MGDRAGSFPTPLSVPLRWPALLTVYPLPRFKSENDCVRLLFRTALGGGRADLGGDPEPTIPERAAGRHAAARDVSLLRHPGLSLPRSLCPSGGGRADEGAGWRDART